MSAPVPPLRVWALEPYFGGSHRQFLQGFRAHSAHEIFLQTLPGRHWKWRLHGGAFALAEQSRSLVAAEGAPQLLFASSMLDVATYLTLAHPAAARAPLVLYFHENQLTYPLPPGVERDLGYGVKQLAGAAAAEGVFFNSAFHRREFLTALEELAVSLPDEPPRAAIDAVAAKAEVLPLGCDLRRFDRFRPNPARPGDAHRWGDPARGPLIIWNQRWEYDKAPGDLFRALYALQEQGVRFRVAIAGPNQGLPAAEFVEAHARLEGHIVQWGALAGFGDYASLLWAADVVVSTALHEFFGVAVVEAIYCACRPVLPSRLSYPELVPAEAHDQVLYPEGGLVPLLRRALEEGLPWSEHWQRTWVAPYDWGSIGPKYDAEVWATWERGTSRRERFC